MTLIIMGVPLHGLGQKLQTFDLRGWRFRSEVFTIKKFQPWSTGALIKESSQLGIPTIFSLEAPKLDRLKVVAHFEEAKETWLRKNRRLTAIPVHYFPVMASQGMNFGREAFIWVIGENGSILNIELIRQGTCRAEAMLLDDQNESYVLVPKGLYLDIKKQMIEAERLAKHDNLGIWRK